MAEIDVGDIIQKLLEQNLFHIVEQIFKNLSVPDMRLARLVNKAWKKLIEDDFMSSEAFLKMELDYSIRNVRPCLIDLDTFDGAGKALLGTEDWNPIITETALL